MLARGHAAFPTLKSGGGTSGIDLIPNKCYLLIFDTIATGHLDYEGLRMFYNQSIINSPSTSKGETLLQYARNIDLVLMFLLRDSEIQLMLETSN